jgi:transposase
MTTKSSTLITDHDVVNPICAGIDVHRDIIHVTLTKSEGKKLSLEYRKFRTIKSDLKEMLIWLLENECPIVGMESTGKYWLPILNVLEGHVAINLYNARHAKNIPGKKTDKSDSKWIAMITRHEYIASSFIPCAQTRHSRNLARFRKSTVESRTRIRQQIHGILDTCGIRIATYVSDIFGRSGWFLLDRIANNLPISKDILRMHLHGSLIKKIDDILEAMDGDVCETHRIILRMQISEEKRLSGLIREVEEEIEKLIIDTPKKIDLLERLKEIPGFAERSALLLIAELGTDLSSFPDAKHFSSWAGLAPGRKESAGKNRSGRIQVRQHYLRALLVEVAFAATRCKETYYNSKYFKLKGRMSSQKAVIAIARKLSVAVYKIIKEGKTFKELTPDYIPMDSMARDFKTLKYMTKRLDKETIKAYLDSLSDPPTDADLDNPPPDTL